jgi:Tfp pilus assembly protein PilO
MKPLNLSPREKQIANITILVIAIGLVFNFFISPILAKVTGLNDEIARKEYMLKKYRHFQEKSRELNLSDNSYAGLTKSITPDEAISEMFGVVSEAAKKYSLNVQKIKPLPAGSGRSSKQAVLEVDVAGNFSAIFKFVNAVEDSPLFMRVFTFHLMPSGGNDSNLHCTVAFSRVLF